MKKTFRLCLTLLLMAGFLCAEDFLLVRDGKPVAVIVKTDSKYEKILADFNAELKAATGAVLPIVDEAETNDQPKIKFVLRDDFNLRSEDQFSIMFPDSANMLINCSPLSIRWALNHILEKHAGVSFLFNAKCGRSYNSSGTVAIPRQTITFSPSFPLGRNTYLSTPMTRPWFYMKDGASCNHELYKHAFPAEKYLHDNSYPEVIRPLLNGKRLEKIPHNPPHAPSVHWQPCYSNPETARIATENILEYLAKNPQVHSISLTINDNGGFCECLECEKANGGKKNFDFSEVYFTWVNRVVEQISPRHPELVITASAYAQTYNPPSFKLHESVVVFLAIDLYSATDPAMMEKHKAIITHWGQKASTLGIWDYAWGYPYMTPRIYPHVHAEMLRHLYHNGGRFYFGENECYDAKEGPKLYLLHRLLIDIDTDVDKTLSEWYSAAVGPAAAPYLQKYYDFWEEYFQSDAVRATPWFNSKRNVYMTQGDLSHIYGLKPGDLARARSFIEKAAELAGTDAEKERAAHLMRHFEYAEARLTINNAEIIPTDGKLHSAQEAVQILQSFAKMPKFLQKKKSICEAMEKEPWLNTYYTNKYFRKSVKLDDDGSDALLQQLVMASEFITDQEVKLEMEKLSVNNDLPPMISTVAKALCNPDNLTNLFVNGDAELEPLTPNFEIHPEHRRPGNGVRSSEQKYSGDFSVKIMPKDYTLLFLQAKAEPSTSYLLSMKIFIPHSNAEAYMMFTAYPSRGGTNQAWRNLPKMKVPTGTWQTYTTHCVTRDNSDGVKGYVFLKEFGAQETVYIDDVRLFKISE